METIKHKGSQPEADVLDSLRADWKIIVESYNRAVDTKDQEYADSKAALTISFDQQRAATLAKYDDRGLHQRAMAKALGIPKANIDRLLRYHRFVAFAAWPPIGGHVSEGRFRAYWYQLSPKLPTSNNLIKDPVRAAAAKAAYLARRDEAEAAVFRQIIERIQAGQAPMKAAERRGRPPKFMSNPKTDTKPTRDGVPWRKAYRAHIRERQAFYRQHIEPQLKELMALSKADHPMLSSPGWIAARCKKIDKEVKQFFRMADKEVPRT